jgi:ribosomal protein S18 acetylase RimI-like enzyme
VDADQTFAYEVKRAALHSYVEQVWGWDEEFQREFHRRDWRLRRPDIVVVDGREVGTIDIERRETEYHLGEFYLLPAFQRQGIGSQLLERLTRAADVEEVPVGLEVLKINPVRALYERHGFTVVGESSTHYQMVRLPA